DAVVGGDAVVNKPGQGQVGIAHFPGTGYVAAHHKTLVKAHHFSKHPVLEQVVANGNTGGQEAVLEQQVVDHHRVKHNVPMIRDKQMRVGLGQIFQAAVSYSGRGVFDQLAHVL